MRDIFGWILILTCFSVEAKTLKCTFDEVLDGNSQTSEFHAEWVVTPGEVRRTGNEDGVMFTKLFTGKKYSLFFTETEFNMELMIYKTGERKQDYSILSVAFVETFSDKPKQIFGAYVVASGGRDSIDASCEVKN